MTLPPGSDLLFTRSRAELLNEILATRTAYVPDWHPADGAVGHGLADITAGFLELLEERLARVPEHRHAVMLDMLGVSVLPAQGARTHVLLTAAASTRNARVPAGTRIGAKVAGQSDPVVFETQDTVAISPATLVEVHSVEPGSDAEADHSADLLARRPFTIFSGLGPVGRDLFVGDDQLLAFDGRAVVELDIALSTPASPPLHIDWAWWDGDQWRAFTATVSSSLLAGSDDSIDGTADMTRSGTVRLVAPVARSKPLEQDGITTYWLRGRVRGQFAASSSLSVPTISRLRLSTVNEHARLIIQRTDGVASPTVTIWWPGAGAADITLHVRDVTTLEPMDRYCTTDPDPAHPRLKFVPGYLPAAHSGSPIPVDDPAQISFTPHYAIGDGDSVRFGVSLSDSRQTCAVTTVAHEPTRAAFDSKDDLSEPMIVGRGDQIDIAVTRGLTLDKGIADQRVVDLTKTFAPLGPSPIQGTAFHFACETATLRPNTCVTLVLERPITAAEQADANADLQRDAARATKIEIDRIVAVLRGATVTGKLDSALQALTVPLPALLGSALVDGAGNQLETASKWFADIRQPIVDGITTALKSITSAEKHEVIAAGALLVGMFPVLGNELAKVVTGLNQAKKDLTAGNTVPGIADVLPTSVPNGLLAGEPRVYLDAVIARFAQVHALLTDARSGVTTAAADLEKISPAALAVELARAETTTLSPPDIAWEYYDGTRWAALGVSGDPSVVTLQASGALHFVVPADMSEVDVTGDVRRWLRARLARGTFSHMSLVSWTDTLGTVNFLPVVEPRPPLIDRIEVFYSHRSAPADASVVVAHDNDTWSDLTTAVRWPGPGATPFATMPERAPTLYLGLDGDLPADRIGLWMQPTTSSPWGVPQRPLWEGWDGLGWSSLTADDGTDGLRRAGVIGLNWPGTDAAPGASVSGALGTTITLLGRGAAARFAAGDRLMLVDVQGQEPVVVDAATGETVTTRVPLSRAFAGAELIVAPPARFGVPRTWIRATFDQNAPAPQLALALIAAHAVEVAQIERLTDELLGSGDGSPSQILTARRFPFAGEVVLEVRELDGDRADLDQSVLTRTLLEGGIDPRTVRVVSDSRSGRVIEVWVPWTSVRALGSTGPQDRVFVPDRAQGRLLFGGNGHGRPLPAGRDNVRIRSYSTTGGAIGNVAAGAVNQLLSAVAVAEVTNPIQASGGADVESLNVALRRAPALLRHRRVAVTERDVEAIAIEATPAVVRARALGARDEFGRWKPGAIRVVIVPRDGNDRPQPGAAVLATVREAIVAAVPAVAAELVTVEGPVYLPVGVSLTVLPLASAEAGAIRERVLDTLRDLMHPLRGGPDGTGWDFGLGAHISDIARVLESVQGVDAVTDLELSVNGVARGDSVDTGPNSIVCAGPLAVRLGGGA